MKQFTKEEFERLLGMYLKSIRNSKNMSQEQFAEILEIHRNYVGSIENGKRNVSAYMLINILSKLSIRLSDFEKKCNLLYENQIHKKADTSQ